MGVLRIKEDVDALLDKDPYELFSLDEPHSIARGMTPRVWTAAAAGVVLAFGVAAATFWRAHRDARSGADLPYAYFEIRAIDPDGRPVAGALVKDGEHQVGVTDSFGEWRRFMRVKPGSTVMLQLTKKNGAVLLSANKNVAVPLVGPEAGDLELTGSVQLQRPGAKGAPGAQKGSGQTVASGLAARLGAVASKLGLASAPEAPAVDGTLALVPGGTAARAGVLHVRGAGSRSDAASGGRTGVDGVAAAGRAGGGTIAAGAGASGDGAGAMAARRGSAMDLAAAPRAAGANAAADEQEGNDELSDPTMAVEVEHAAPAQAAAVLPPPGAAPSAATRAALAAQTDDFAALWVMAEGKATPGLNDVVGTMRRRARELGLRIEPTAPWALRVTEIPVAGEGARLLRVDGVQTKDGHSERLFSFLRNYGDDSLQTARDLLWAMTVHAPKAYRVTRQADGFWQLEAPAAKIWTLAPGHVVYDAGGLPFTVTGSGQGPLRLVAAGSEPCATGTSCTVSRPGIARQSPVRGWKRLKLKVLGDTGNDTLVYVSGYEARRLQDHVYEYWGAATAAANVTVLRGGHLVFRGRAQAGGGALPSVSLPALAISRR